MPFELLLIGGGLEEEAHYLTTFSLKKTIFVLSGVLIHYILCLTF